MGAWSAILLGFFILSLKDVQIVHALMEGGLAGMLDRLSEKYPNLDPIHIEHVPISMTKGSCSLQGSLDDVTVLGLSALEMDLREMDTDAMRYHIAVGVPVLTLSSKYKYSAEVCATTIPEVSGRFSISFDNLTVVVRTNFTLNDGITQMDYLELTIDFQDIKLDLDSIMGNRKLGQVVSNMVKTHGRDLFYALKPLLKVKAQETLKSFVNKYLAESKGKELNGGTP